MEAESKSTLKREGGQFVRMRGTALRAGIQIFDHVEAFAKPTIQIKKTPLMTPKAIFLRKY